MIRTAADALMRSVQEVAAKAYEKAASRRRRAGRAAGGGGAAGAGAAARRGAGEAVDADYEVVDD